MEPKNITDFLNEDYSDSALYMNYRSTPSYIDGLKNSARKVVFALKKKSLKEEQKVSNLAGAVIDASQYLHGNVSLEGVIVTMSQSYCGANNLPILEGVGAFGTRMFPQASSSRYIFAKQQEYFNDLFNTEDDTNLESQQFEGDRIEPRFYVPTLPLILINGSTGIGVGFASKILNRSLSNIITATKNKIEGKRNMDKYFYPSWGGFRGTVDKIDDTKWQINGIATRPKENKVLISELPITFTLEDYLAFLRKLRDNGTIKKFYDNSDTQKDQYNFEIVLGETEVKKSNAEVFKDLKLNVVVSECLTCIDENNAIREYNNVKEIFDDFYRVKIDFMAKRKESSIKRLERELKEHQEIVDFISGVISGDIKVNNVKKSVLEKDLVAKGFTIIDRLIAMPIYNLTKEKMDDHKLKLKNKKAELKTMKAETPEALWLKDIVELETKLKKKGFI